MCVKDGFCCEVYILNGNKVLHCTNKLICMYIRFCGVCSWQNGTRCRDDVNILRGRSIK